MAGRRVGVSYTDSQAAVGDDAGMSYRITRPEGAKRLNHFRKSRRPKLGETMAKRARFDRCPRCQGMGQVDTECHDVERTERGHCTECGLFAFDVCPDCNGLGISA